MLILTNKKKKKLLNILVANQIIMNHFDTLKSMEKFAAFGKFSDNSAEAIAMLGGLNVLQEATNYIFEEGK